MCVLCTEFVATPHWTDQARLSGPETGEHPWSRRGERARRVELANAVLAHYGLKASDWGGRKYVLRDGKGRSELVDDLGSLWPAAEKLCGRRPDPLDPGLLKSLTPGGE